MFGNPLLETVLTQHQERAVQAVDRYWHQLAAGRGVAKRSAIDPSVIQDALEYAFVGERLSEGHARVRVAGGALIAVADMEVAGMPLAVMIAPKDRAKFTDRVAHVFDDPAIVTLGLTGDVKFGQPPLSAQLRLYPLTDDQGRVTRMMGTFVTVGRIGSSPRRFTIEDAQTEPVRETAPQASRPGISRGHLRLVVSNA
ncbi:PAS domain-containing protein [Marivita hallyeonensis]|uniref:PAS domain-containing protein n=2 Tax=Marivita hallyeonensis TaxID=996342 RepID=A0A1M5QTW4_9RHOB|nr:PAS domain-containing protein [Marivita hallyeonensis]